MRQRAHFSKGSQGTLGGSAEAPEKWHDQAGTESSLLAHFLTSNMMLKRISISNFIPKRQGRMLQWPQAVADVLRIKNVDGVRRIDTKTNIADEVAVGKGCEAIVGNAEEGPLIVPSRGVERIEISLPPDLSPIGALVRVVKKR